MTALPTSRVLSAPCADCEISRRNAKAAGHRDWRTGVCGECAWLNTDTPEIRAMFACATEDMQRIAAREMGIPYIGPDLAPDQPDLFGAAA